MNSRLFVYGSLLRDVRGSRSELLGPGAALVGRGRVRGRLYDLGDYPGLVPAPEASWVTGEVYELADAGAALARLDAYEGCAPQDPPPHEYQRIESEVVLEGGGRVRAWVYAYRGALTGARELPSGDYRKA